MIKLSPSNQKKATDSFRLKYKHIQFVWWKQLHMIHLMQLMQFKVIPKIKYPCRFVQPGPG